MAYAQYADVAKRHIEDVSELEELIEVRLGDAEMLIRDRIPDLDDKILDGTLDEAKVVYTECEAVLRLIRNPEGYLQESDGSYSYMLRQSVASGEIEILPKEWKLLGLSGGAFVIRPYVDIATTSGVTSF